MLSDITKDWYENTKFQPDFNSDALVDVLFADQTIATRRISNLDWTICKLKNDIVKWRYAQVSGEMSSPPATPHGSDSPLAPDRPLPSLRQVGGSHYKVGIQPVDYIYSNGLGFLEGCVVKRVTRYNRMGGKGKEDLEKAIHELEMLKEKFYG